VTIRFLVAPAALLAASLTASRPARADDLAPAPKSFAIDVGAGTYFPMALAVEGTVELPFRILVQGDVGYMPSPYSNTIVDLLKGFNAINSFEEELLKIAIQNSFVMRLAAGFRPFSSLGLEVYLGYALVTAGGGVSGSDVVNAYLKASGSSMTVPQNAKLEVPLATTLHNFQATVAWRFLFFGDHLVVRPSISYLQCVSSSTGVTLATSRPLEQAIVNRINSEIQGTLDPYFTTYVKIPVIGVTAAYRF
jgi:hypothetical protein